MPEATNSEADLCVGVVVGAHGIRGAVRIKSFTADPADVAAYGAVHDRPGARRWHVTVTGNAKGTVVARLSGIDNRDAAEAMKGVELFVPRSALPVVTDADEFYHADLIGLRAETADGTEFGTVKAVHDFGAGDLLDIARATGGSVLLQFTRAVVPLVDLAAGRLVVVPPTETDGSARDAEDARGAGNAGTSSRRARTAGGGRKGRRPERA